MNDKFKQLLYKWNGEIVSIQIGVGSIEERKALIEKIAEELASEYKEADLDSFGDTYKAGVLLAELSELIKRYNVNLSDAIIKLLAGIGE